MARKVHGRLRCVQPRIVESVAAHSTTGQNGLLHPQRRETWLYRRVASDDASHPGARSATVVELFETIKHASAFSENRLSGAMMATDGLDHGPEIGRASCRERVCQ